MKITRFKLNEMAGVDDIIATTPYMLRNDGALLTCGDAHPYIKMFFSDTIEETIIDLKKHIFALKWFYDNTLVENTKNLILNVLAKLDCDEATALLTELNIEFVKLDTDITEDITSLNLATNKEFCRVRTSNFKYKYGGDNGEIYFRLSDMTFNWFDLIWKTVYRFANSIKTVTIMRDFATFGKQFDYCYIGNQPINKMSVEEFLSIAGSPRLESKNV